MRKNKAPDLTLNTEECKVVNTLKRLAKKWPSGLWLFCTGNGMNVMRCGDDGEHVYGSNTSVDPQYAIDCVEGIDHDGGDW